MVRQRGFDPRLRRFDPCPRSVSRQQCKHEPAQIYEVFADWYDPPESLGWRPDTRDWYVDGTCEFGHCLTLNCPVCGANSGGGFGPVNCPCDDTVAYYAMRRKPRVAVKPSVANKLPSNRRH